MIDGPEMSPATLAFLRESPLGADDFEWLDGDEMPQPYRMLLVHEGDMTSTLERFHGSQIRLDVLRVGPPGGCYVREVILWRESDRRPVEYGMLEADIDAYPPGLRPAVLAGERPLGFLLNSARVSFVSRRLGLFRVAAERMAGLLPDGTGGGFRYGRYNQLLTADRRSLAKIIEILPEEEPTK
jgi:hypothetical protein